MPLRRALCIVPVVLLLLAGRMAVGEENPPAPATDQSTSASLEHARKLMERQKYGEAEKELEEVVLIDEKLYGVQAEKTLSDRLELAVAQGRAGDSSKAEAQIRAL